MPGSTYQCDVMGSDSQLKDCSTWITGWETCLPSSLYKLEGLSPPKSYNVQESRKGMGLGTVVHSSSKDPKKNPLKYESLACAPLWSTVLSSEVNMFTMGTCFRKPIEVRKIFTFLVRIKLLNYLIDSSKSKGKRLRLVYLLPTREAQCE